jgi:hypothetical protein
MPMVGNKKFAYTKKGKTAAKKYAKKAKSQRQEKKEININKKKGLYEN